MGKRIQRYIFAEWLKVFGIASALILGLLVVQEVYNRLDALLTRGATTVEIMLSFAYALPLYLPSIVPLMLLLSVLFSVSSLHRKNEIIAMKAAGISLCTITAPLIVAAGLCAIMIFALNSVVIPWSVRAQESLRQEFLLRGLNEGDVHIPDKDRRILNLGSLNFRENRLWLIGVFFPIEGFAEDVTVYDMDPESGRERYRIRAASARFDTAEGYWIFRDGHELFYDGTSDEPYRNRAFEVLEKPDYTDPPGLMLTLRKKPRDLSLVELGDLIQAHEGHENSEIRPYQIRFYRILASPFVCFLVVAFGVPFAAAGVRTNPMIGISKAISMFMVFFLVSNVSTVMGEGGLITPLSAALMPLVLIGVISSRIFVKAL